LPPAEELPNFQKVKSRPDPGVNRLKNQVQ